MKTTFVSKENNTVKFTMEFTAEEFDGAVVKAYQASKHQFMVDGFRKGKAPRSIIEKHYGEGIFFEDAINNLFSENYTAAIDELELEVIDSPAADFSEIGHGKPFTITLTVPVYPVVEVKDYIGVEVEQVKETVKEEDINKEIEMLQKRNSRMVVAER
ncbi:MAG: trigger factor family protein, partial [Firmicutes bacterium]|nr:trigger factor family protein [Bacillota bacterium]